MAHDIAVSHKVPLGRGAIYYSSPSKNKLMNNNKYLGGLK